MRSTLAMVVGLGVLAGLPPAAIAQPPTVPDPRPVAPTAAPPDQSIADGGRIWSMGQPPVFAWHGSLGVDTTTPGVLAAVGVERAVGNPLAGVLSVRGEAVGGAGHGGAEAGLRLLGVSPLVRLHAGLDYDLRRQRVDWLFGSDFNVRRGGVFGGGTGCASAGCRPAITRCTSASPCRWARRPAGRAPTPTRRRSRPGRCRCPGGLASSPTRSPPSATQPTP
ncbi:MAG: hypothetical protein AB7U83_01330 [Vicinamibacterales bacterium]